MRALLIGLLALALGGCSMFSKTPADSAKSTTTSPATQPAKPAVSQPGPAKLYTNAEDLIGKPFRELGQVSGESCQVSNQDSPASIPAARRHMQINAAKKQANAVLQHSCEITSGTPGCYRQAVCIGSALVIPTK